MNTTDKDIRLQTLLERYYQAETTQEEELELYLVLADEPEDSPLYPDALILRSQWEGLVQPSKQEEASAPIPEVQPIYPKHRLIKWLSGVAAVFVLGLLIWKQFTPPERIHICGSECGFHIPYGDESPIPLATLFGEDYDLSVEPGIIINEKGFPCQLIGQQLWGWKLKNASGGKEDMQISLYQTTSIEQTALGELGFVVELSTFDEAPGYVVRAPHPTTSDTES